MGKPSETPLVDVSEAGRTLGVSASTVWRLLRRGALPSVRRAGRRLIPRQALARRAETRQEDQIPPLAVDHPIFRLVGAGRGGGRRPGARDKHAILDE
jgi:excisionase family DNA binding protein